MSSRTATDREREARGEPERIFLRPGYRPKDGREPGVPGNTEGRSRPQGRLTAGHLPRFRKGRVGGRIPQLFPVDAGTPALSSVLAAPQ